jgi:transmembrane sensor
MADKSWDKNKKNDRDPDRFLTDLSETEREDLKRVWDDSREVKFNEPEIPDHEIEGALHNVNKKLGFDSGSEEEKSKSIFLDLRYLAAAAIIFISAIFGFLLSDKKYTVPPGELYSYTLSDGTNLELNSGSEISHNRLFGMTNRNIKLNGEAYFEVAGNDHTFRVHANSTTVEVTGTSFNIRSWSDDPGSGTIVSVLSGSVQFYPAQAPDRFVRITEGFSSDWQSNMIQPEDPVLITPENVLAWRNRNLAFINQPLEVIFSELERKYNVTIITEDQEIKNSVLTTFYSDPEDVESILTDITTVKGLTYSRTANGYRISSQ